MSILAHLAYAAAWLLFAVLHSGTAGAGVRTGLGRLFGRAHRLVFNALALVEIAAVMGLGAWLGRGAHMLPLPAPVHAVQLGMTVLGAVLLLSGLAAYRIGPFLGWAQLRGEEDEDQPLVIAGLHRYIRHPLYSAALLLLWGRVIDELSLATALWGSLYLVIGSRIEEGRLLARYGEAYRRYRTTTPAFIPRLRG